MADSRIYEAVVVLVPEIEDSAVEEHVDKFKELLEKNSAEIETVDLWGRRRLEYEINKKREGIYFVVLFKMGSEGNPLKEIERRIGLNEEILRHLIVRRDDLVTERTKKRKIVREKKRIRHEKRQAEIAASKAAAVMNEGGDSKEGDSKDGDAKSADAKDAAPAKTEEKPAEAEAKPAEAAEAAPEEKKEEAAEESKA
jgi:small subunit ribosomal protein S6